MRVWVFSPYNIDYVGIPSRTLVINEYSGSWSEYEVKNGYAWVLIEADLATINKMKEDNRLLVLDNSNATAVYTQAIKTQGYSDTEINTFFSKNPNPSFEEVINTFFTERNLPRIDLRNRRIVYDAVVSPAKKLSDVQKQLG